VCNSLLENSLFCVSTNKLLHFNTNKMRRILRLFITRSWVTHQYVKSRQIHTERCSPSFSIRHGGSISSQRENTRFKYPPKNNNTMMRGSTKERANRSDMRSLVETTNRSLIP
jgi:hypothetical protein